MKKLKEFFEDYDWWVAVLSIVIFVILLVSGICACAAVFMVLWNYAVVAALTIAAPIGFWHALCLVCIPLFICSPIIRRNID